MPRFGPKRKAGIRGYFLFYVKASEEIIIEIVVEINLLSIV
jgi:hypothetical protein